MIESSRVKLLADKLGISEQVVWMEAYQMVILNDLGELPLAKHLVFKGGTCLRLAYGSYRFSEDLDFSMLKMVSFKDFKQAIVKVASRYGEMEVEEVFDMKETLFARIVVKRDRYRIGVKIEVSKRKEKWVKNKDYVTKVLGFELGLWKPLWQVTTMERIYLDKLETVKHRRKPRDWFDLWFLSQVLDKPWAGRVKVAKRLMSDRVRFLLPKAKRSILEEFNYEDD